MYCKYCGVPIDDDSIYCKSCGKNVSAEKEEKDEERLTIEDYKEEYYLTLTNNGEEVAFDLQDIIEYEGKKYIYALPAPVHYDEGYQLTNFVIYEVEDGNYLGDFVRDERYEILARKAQYNHNLKDPHRASVQKSFDDLCKLFNFLSYDSNESELSKIEVSNKEDVSDVSLIQKFEQESAPMYECFGGKQARFNFDIYEKASEHDKPIITEILKVWDFIADAILYTTFDDTNKWVLSEKIQYRARMHNDFYWSVNKLEDNEIKDEIKRAFIEWRGTT